jgi:uncharacterized protein YbbC (DUF1343 family)
VGAPGLDTGGVLRALAEFSSPGVRFESVTFTPRRPGDTKYADTLVQGIRLTVTDRAKYDPIQAATALLRAVSNQVVGDCLTCTMTEREASARSQFRFAWVPAQFDRLAGDRQLRTLIEVGIPPASRWSAALEQFRARRRPFLIYPE